MPKNDNSLQEVGRYIGLAFLFPVCAFIGWLIGSLLDRTFHTHFLTLLFLFFGIAAGFIEVIRELNQDDGRK